jgi:hypothetical protein
MEQSKILFKLPTRSRPERVFEVLNETVRNLNGDNYSFLLTLDEDDETMNNDVVIEKLKSYKNMTYNFGISKSKIDAVNRDMGLIDNDWNILVLLSDDMVPIYHGFDDVIREKFNEHFNDFDGVTWFNDGVSHNSLNTLCILGKKYYERFNYIYHPEYTSLYADNEFTDVANKLNKQIYFDLVLIEHRQYSIGNNHNRYDKLYEKNDAFLMEDGKVHVQRRNINFNLI